MRFARADGSKGGNKRPLEEATPWVDMKTDILESKKKKRKVKKNRDLNVSETQINTSSGKKASLLPGFTKSVEYGEQTAECSISNHSKKMSEDVLNETRSVEPATKKTKKIVTKKLNKNSVDDVNDTLSNRLPTHEGKEKKSNKFKDGKSKNDRNKVSKVKSKDDNKVEFVIENGKRYKIFKNGVKKPYFDLPFEEGELMTRYNNLWVKRDMVKVLDGLKEKLKEEGLNKKQISNKVLHEERKAHKKLSVELLREQIKRVEEETGQKTEKILTEQKISKKNSKLKNTRNEEQKDIDKSKFISIGNQKMKKTFRSEEQTDGTSEIYPTIKKTKKDSKLKKNMNTPAKDPKKNVKSIDKNERKSKESSFVEENGNKFRLFENGTKKPWFDLIFEENELMTIYNTRFVKREVLQKLNDLKKSLEDQGMDSEKIETKMKFEEKLAHNKLRKELIGERKLELSPRKNKFSVPKGVQNAFKPSIQSKFKPSIQNNEMNDTHKHDSSSGYEETEKIAKFDGYYVLRNHLNRLESIKLRKLERIINARENGDKSEELTPEENIGYQRLMKKEKRREQRMLDIELKAAEHRDTDYDRPNIKNKKPVQSKGLKFEEKYKDMVKFDGYWVKKEAANRLGKLSEKLEEGGANQEEISATLKLERRKEERALKRETKLFCYNCRKPGHLLFDCPEESASACICFGCGSTEHTVRDCPVKNKDGAQFAYATCFVCGKTGHISRECPDNPRGLYPNGGCCNQCGSVEHLKMNCTEYQVEQTQRNDFRGDTIDAQKGIETIDFDNSPAPEKNTTKWKKPKKKMFD